LYQRRPSALVRHDQSVFWESVRGVCPRALIDRHAKKRGQFDSECLV
jgi:hypothetical protein